jgi:hypothetical protein
MREGYYCTTTIKLRKVTMEDPSSHTTRGGEGGDFEIFRTKQNQTATTVWSSVLNLRKAAAALLTLFFLSY